MSKKAAAEFLDLLLRLLSCDGLRARPSRRPARRRCVNPTWRLSSLHLPGAIHLELEDQVAAGLTPLEAIAAATSEAARVLGAEGEIGTIAPGKRADLILLEADPREDIRNTRRIWMVIQRGRIVDREALVRSAREQTERQSTPTR